MRAIAWGLLAGLLWAGAAAAAEPAGGAATPAAAEGGAAPLGPAERAWQALVEGGRYGKLTLDLRARIELADIDLPTMDDAQAYTVRTRLGYLSPKWRGLSFFAEGENVLSLDDDAYWDGVHHPNGETLIADPETLHLNQLYAKYENADLASSLIAGRQRITLDDHRFVGNVGWRQNEQTYDAVAFQSSLGVKQLKLFYAYLWYVSRIWGDPNVAAPANRDFDSNSHLVNLSYSFGPALTATAFAYLLDFQEDAPDTLSSRSYGLRLSGARELGGAYQATWLASYAYQTDADEHPVDYGAHYAALDGSLGHASLGAFGLGYELLGSDDGMAQFLTPLATLHAFNGWADAFLDNGGPRGLQDLYAYVSPKLPWKLASKLVYHRFWSHEGRTHLADEFDVQLARPINQHLTVLTKAAYLDGDVAGREDRWRFWLEATLKF